MLHYAHFSRPDGMCASLLGPGAVAGVVVIGGRGARAAGRKKNKRAGAASARAREVLCYLMRTAQTLWLAVFAGMAWRTTQPVERR